MTFEESQAYYHSFAADKSLQDKDIYIQICINGGEKFSQWLKKINSLRSEDTKIRLTSKGSTRGIPINSPSSYGPSTIKEKFLKLKAKMPESMFDIIYGDAPLTDNIKMTDQEFILLGRSVSSLYQSSVRWVGSMRFKDYYTKRSVADVRGFYYLKNILDLDSYLANLSGLPEVEAKLTIKALIGICHNFGYKKSYCAKNLAKAVRQDKVVEYKNYYWAAAQKMWDSFYRITDPRRDIEWNSKAPGVMKIKFKDPNNNKVANWLKENVEDEFTLSTEGWGLDITYRPGRLGDAYIEFKKNVTPHVSGGNKIVMDANTPLEEYSVKWTIRHEFGHILRLPDCYVEFYEPENNLMINYQLDTTDLMCSRAGRMNQRIFDELKRVYYKK